MKPVIALPFTEMTVQVIEDNDATCLLRVKGQKQTVVGRKAIVGKVIWIKTEEGWKPATPKVVPVVEVITRE